MTRNSDWSHAFHFGLERYLGRLLLQFPTLLTPEPPDGVFVENLVHRLNAARIEVPDGRMLVSLPRLRVVLAMVHSRTSGDHRSAPSNSDHPQARLRAVGMPQHFPNGSLAAIVLTTFTRDQLGMLADLKTAHFDQGWNRTYGFRRISTNDTPSRNVSSNDRSRSDN